MRFPEVSRRIVKALDNMEMSAQELSNLSGVGKSSISHYVNGSHCPSNIAAFKLGNVLNVAPEWLMGFDVPMSRKDTAAQALEDIELIRKFSLLTPKQRSTVTDLIDTFLESN